MMVTMEKNNPLYIGYNECNDSDHEKRNNKLYVGYNDDVQATWSQ